MANLFNLLPDAQQEGFAFPQQLTEKYMPRAIEEFAGLGCTSLSFRVTAWRRMPQRY